MVDIQEAKRNLDLAYCEYHTGKITREQYAKVHGAYFDACRQLPKHDCDKCPIGGCPCCNHIIVELGGGNAICKRCEHDKLEAYIESCEYEEFYFTKGSYTPYQDLPSHKARAEKIIRMAHPKSVLDVGCAYGYVVKHLKDKGVDAYGIDVSKWCEQKAKKIIPHRFILASADSIPCKDKRFDLLYCEGVLEHIKEELIPKVISEFTRVARQRILQISFDDEVLSAGHRCMHEAQWWYERMPEHTWLYMGNGGIDESNEWVYKG